MHDIIIIGGGVSGLAAARALSTAGKKVVVLEASSRPGGRILTKHDPAFSTRIETGAEFIHGDLPKTKAIVSEAGLNTSKVKGDLWNARHNHLEKQKDFFEGSDEIMRELKNLRSDTSIQSFLELYFSSEKYKDLRESVLGFIKGYELADPANASALALRKAWSEEGNGSEFRIREGYGSLVDFLVSKCIEKGCEFHFDSIAKKINWQAGAVQIETANGNSFSAKQVIITISLGIWQSRPDATAHLSFLPAIPEKFAAAREMGFGEIIKFVLEFKEPFWEKITPNAGFIFSDQKVPTWWSQLEEKNNILTGWLGGPDAKKYLHLPEESLLQIAIDSLSGIFKIQPSVLFEKLTASGIFNWSTDKFSLGGYSYQSLNIEEHKKIMMQPIANTLFFAGEALSYETAGGTVEAAIASGMSVAGEILKRQT